MIPSKFKFLSTIGPLPKMVNFALDKLGVEEVPGPLSNQDIMMMARVTKLNKVYTNDDIPWCGLFMAYVVISSGRTPVKNPLTARNWTSWGVAASTAKLGDILVFERGTGGHVGLYIAEDKEGYYVLGGNQANTVSIVRIKKDRLLAIRRPEYRLAPFSAKQYFLAASGEFSSNEA